MTRRELLLTCSRLGLLAPMAGIANSALGLGTTRAAGASLAALTPAQEKLLDDSQRAIFRFFWEQADPHTGLVKDRARADGDDDRSIGSTAATGFGLTALCIADRRGFAAPGEAEKRALATLRYLWGTLPNVRGWFYHFLDVYSGERRFNSEVSSIDTALLLCGVLTAGEYFQNPEIRRLSRQIYERTDFQWMLNGGRTLTHGWKPESGFLQNRWDHYSEHMMLDLLAIASPAHAVPASVWDAWSRPIFDYYGLKYIGSSAPLFVHQYSHAWFDFRGRRDRYANYFENSIAATKAHRQFCIDLQQRFSDYSAELWGITASDSSRGYQVWGGPPAHGPIDGTVVPAAAGGSVVFLPKECIQVLAHLRDKYGNRAWRRYGFVDALNPLTGWFDPDVIGIDAGIMMLMAENARSGFVWQTFMKSDAAQRGMQRAGFHSAD